MHILIDSALSLMLSSVRLLVVSRKLLILGLKRYFVTILGLFRELPATRVRRRTRFGRSLGDHNLIDGRFADRGRGMAQVAERRLIRGLLDAAELVDDLDEQSDHRGWLAL